MLCGTSVTYHDVHKTVYIEAASARGCGGRACGGRACGDECRSGAVPACANDVLARRAAASSITAPSAVRKVTTSSFVMKPCRRAHIANRRAKVFTACLAVAASSRSRTSAPAWAATGRADAGLPAAATETSPAARSAQVLRAPAASSLAPTVLDGM